ncbi:G patch domain-containing protein 3-like [Mercenaria mercenaria]|uniref:G patch domain-containing protein 3-like n=1 Tax=Mercenaria mercenaria TaxID=6596 RepID=UPI00234E78B1|nr:G patch domain-containing protein 3-like [Mercenaria mercenaria]
MESNANKCPNEEVSYTLINNIPADYHSCDLRNYFSQFIESKGFVCFHFRHRPEKKSLPQSKQVEETNAKRSTCCVVKLKSEKLPEFLKLYNRKHWVDKRGEVMSQVCYISKVKNSMENGSDADIVLKTRGEAKQIPPERENFTESDLLNLPELHPPDIMPNGNVGTPTMIFMDYIKQCRLPPSIIKKLGLSFPKTRSSKQYGSVPFDYGGDIAESCDNNSDESSQVLTASGHEIVPEKESCDKEDCNSSKCTDENITEISESRNMCTDADQTDRSSKPGGVRKKKRSWRDAAAKERMKLNIEEKMIGKSEESEEDNDSCEEWERHEALYDDPANQERNKERLYEEEIELKWEKGGSGLVFYTDAQYWQAQEGDFDEQTADDWDVDMSAYYEEGAGDQDARDFLKMRQEKHRREGIEATDRFTAGIAVKRKKEKSKGFEEDAKIGKFEAHTKGFGRKILENQGWTEGQGLGSTIRGIADALDNEGQKPKDRRGIG